MSRREHLHIIVTDKNHHVRSLLKRELEREGYKVTVVTNGPKVYEMIREGKGGDLVLLDPEILSPYGYSLIDELLVSPPQLPVILHAFNELPGLDRGFVNLYYLAKRADSIKELKRIVRLYEKLAVPLKEPESGSQPDYL